MTLMNRPMRSRLWGGVGAWGLETPGYPISRASYLCETNFFSIEHSDLGLLSLYPFLQAFSMIV